MNELKPCPFCGGRARLSFAEVEFGGRNYIGDKKSKYRFQVICNRCHSRGKPIKTDWLKNCNPWVSNWIGRNYIPILQVKEQTEMVREWAEKAMTINQAELAKYFKARGNEWRSTAEVIGWMTSPLVDGYPMPDSFAHLHDSTARRKLSKDIQALNDDPDFDGIIINGTQGYKLATKEEAVAYLRAEVIEAAKKMKRYHGMCQKAGLHGQMDLEGEFREIFMKEAAV